MGAAQSPLAPPKRLEIDGATLLVLGKVLGLEGGALSESVATDVADFLKVQASEISKEALGASDQVLSPFVHASRIEVAFDQKDVLGVVLEQLMLPNGDGMVQGLLALMMKQCMTSVDEADNLLQLIALTRSMYQKGAEIECGISEALQHLRDEDGSFPMAAPDLASLFRFLGTYYVLIQMSHILSKGKKLQLHDFQLAYFISFDDVPLIMNGATNAKPKDDETGCLGLEELMRDLFHTGHGSDWFVETADGRIEVHSFVLMKRNRYFGALLKGSFLENSEKRLTLIDWPKAVMQHLLHFIYTGQGPTPDLLLTEPVIMAKLCDAAHYFDAPKLTDWLKHRVLSNTRLAAMSSSNGKMSLEQVIVLWSAASESQHAGWLAEKCVHLCALGFQKDLELAEFTKLPVGLMKRVVSHSYVRRSNAPVLAAAVAHCAKIANGLGQPSFLDELLRLGAESWLSSEKQTTGRNNPRSGRSRSPRRGGA